MHLEDETHPGYI